MRRILYIMSPGHSGSTLLTLLLGTHPEIATIGERRYLKQRIHRNRNYVESNRCVCGRNIPDCQYLLDLYELGRNQLSWPQRNVDYLHFRYSENVGVNRVARRVQRRIDYGAKFGLVSKILSIPARQLINANLAIMDRVLELENGSVFLDGSKSTVDVAHFESSDNVELTVIHLTRDGRGQYHSYMRVRPGASEEDAARTFCEWHERITRLVNRFEGPVIRVRYEDLCERPLSELRRIVEEVGLDPAGVSLDFRSGASHAIGNSRLMGSDAIKIINRETWRKELTEDQLAVFEEIAGDANRSFGYLD